MLRKFDWKCQKRVGKQPRFKLKSDDMFRYGSMHVAVFIHTWFTVALILGKGSKPRSRSKTKVDKILYFHTAGNDLDDLEYELSHPILKNYLTNRDYLQNLSQIQNLIDKNLMLKTEEIIKKHYEFAKFKKKEGFTKHLKLHRVIRFKNKVT